MKETRITLTIRPELTVEKVDLWQTDVCVSPDGIIPAGFEEMSAWEPVTFVGGEFEVWAWRRPLAFTEHEVRRRELARVEAIQAATEANVKAVADHRARAFEWLGFDPFSSKITRPVLLAHAATVGVETTTTQTKADIAQDIFDVALEATK